MYSQYHIMRECAKKKSFLWHSRPFRVGGGVHVPPPLGRALLNYLLMSIILIAMDTLALYYDKAVMLLESTTMFVASVI